MTIFARPTGTRPGSTLMGRVLPGPIRNRVRYGLKKPEVGPSWVWVLSKNLRPDLRPGPIRNPAPKITKIPCIYIYIYSYILSLIPHFFTLQQPTLTLPQSLLLTSVRQSLILAQSNTPSPSAHVVSQSDTPSVTPPSPPHPHSE